MQIMLLVMTNEKKEIEYDAVSIYKSVYVGMFIFKNIFTVFVFAMGLYSAIKIGHPSFYKPARWLSTV